MEENRLLSMLPRKLIKPEPTLQLNNQSLRSDNSYSSGGAKQDPDPPVALHPFQVTFRMLCRIHIAGGVIGSSGSVIKHLEALTGSKISFESRLPNCQERVVNIMGDATVDRKVSLVGNSGNGGNEDEELVEVSRAQEGLIRVFERVLEIQGGDGNENDDIISVNKGLIGCRLLVASGRIGVVLGKGGTIVDGIRKSSGAKITVLKEQIPACANPHEAIVQIAGGIMAVKKALLGVSHCLQNCMLGEGAHGQMPSNGVSSDQHEESILSHNSDLPTFTGDAVDYHPSADSFSADVDKKLSLDEDSTPRLVVFRFLCSNASAGGVIGKGANIVKYLEKETEASIKFSSLVGGLKERVATISSLENPNLLCSPAQIAVVRVFTRSVEVGLDHALASSYGEGDKLTARILVAKNEIGCLVEEGGRVASDISTATSVEIQLLDADLIPNCTMGDDKVVQIVGKYENVRSALFQITGRLRKNYFPGMALKGAEGRHLSELHVECISLNRRVRSPSSQLEKLSPLSSVDPWDCGLMHKSSCPLSTGLRQKHAKRRGSATRPQVDAGTLESSAFNHESLDEDGTPRLVVFRFLCSNASAGGVIGKGANIVKYLEKETEASIKFSSLVAGLKERVATISSLENPNMSYSPAQIAVVRVFTRSVEVSLDHALASSCGEGDKLTARILVAKNEIGCLVEEGGRVASDISTATSVDIQLLDADLIPNCTMEDDKVVQIMGKYENVRSALCQITGRLRENYFPGMALKGAEGRHLSELPVECISLNRRVRGPSSQMEKLSPLSSVDPWDCGPMHKSSHPLPTGLRQKHAKRRGSATRPQEDAGTLESSAFNHESLDEDGTPRLVVFRFLCSNASAGGVIGKGANIVKYLEKETEASIKFSSLVAGLKERVATISSLENPNMSYSPAQIAVVRVFTRSVEVSLDHALASSFGEGVKLTARILVAKNEIGCLVEGGGRVASDISTATSVEIQLLDADPIPDCTMEDDKVVQIMGKYENVRSALFQITGRLRENYFPGMALKGAEGRHLSELPVECISLNRSVRGPSSQLEKLSPLSAVDPWDHGPIHKSSCPLSTGLRQKHAKRRGSAPRPQVDAGISAFNHERLDEDGTPRLVVFRFLCSNASAGGVIGKGANIVKYLEKETEASIKFSSLVAGLKERVATISSLENPNMSHSPAQIAVVRVFTRSVEVSLDHALASSFGEGDKLTARILVAKNEIGCLVEGGGRVASDISTATSVEIQLLDADPIPNCTMEDDKVVQIIGMHENVRSALFQITGRLRENYFPGMALEVTEGRHLSELTVACSSLNRRVMGPSSQLEQLAPLSSVDPWDRGLMHKLSRPLSTGLRRKHAKSRRSATRPQESAGTLKSSAFNHESKDAILNQTVEMLIPKHIFHLVYGDNGSNLTRLNEISGATIGLQHPSAEDDEGKVTISGAAEQVQIAQTLLRAFILV